MAEPRAVPMSWPRRSRGAAPTSQDSAPAHEAAPPTPCAKREPASSGSSAARPKTTLEADMRASPSNTGGRTPTREASQPAGSAASSVPAG